MRFGPKATLGATALAGVLALGSAVATPTPTPIPTITPVPGGSCGDGVYNIGEDCDLSAGVTCQTGSNTGAGFACSPTCQCACPTKSTFLGDATNAASVLDTGWTGISHQSPTITNGEVSVGISGCAGSSRPCGQCNVSGPIANPGAGAGQLDSQRCGNDASIRCTTDAPCTTHAYLGSLTSPQKCLSGKLKTIGKAAAQYTACHSGGKDPACGQGSTSKTTVAFGKLDLKPPCLTIEDGLDRDTDAADYANTVEAAVGGAAGCDAVKNKLVGKYIAGIMGCYAKAAGKGGLVDNAPGGCTDKVSVKFQNGVNKAELKPPCTASGLVPLGLLQLAANDYLAAQACLLDPSAGGCPGTCQFFFGAPLPLAAGGITTCVVNQFNGPVSGTVNIESGEGATTALLTARVYNGIAIDHPCPRCTDLGGINDGVTGGTCDGGPRVGMACDANGSVPGRPDFGRTSLDCPPDPLSIIAALPIDFSNATDPVTRTVTTSSPTCGDGSGERCLCDTCNNAAATPCQGNADCVAAGATVCGGKRCLGGTNDGAPCANITACPGDGKCGRPGEPSKPSACQDDTATVGILDCTDTAPVDGDGECTSGPSSSTCSVASGHGQRACNFDSECNEPPVGPCPGCCVAAHRPCFLTGSNTGNGKVGTTTLIAVGMEDTPMNDTSSPTLAAVFCVGPTTAQSVNSVAGLPGPGRVTLKGTATGQP